MNNMYDIVMMGRSQLYAEAKRLLKHDEFANFIRFCKFKKNLIDKEWLGKLLRKTCTKPSQKRYLRVYHRVFDGYMPVSRLCRSVHPTGL